MNEKSATLQTGMGSGDDFDRSFRGAGDARPAAEARGAEAVEFTEKTTFGRVRAVDRAEAIDPKAWEKFFGHHSKDQRYYGIVERTLPQNFEYRYLVLEDHGGEVRAIQPFFILDQDLTAGLGRRMRAAVDAARKATWNFLSMKMLMVGCTAGEGRLGIGADADGVWEAEALHEALEIYARHAKVSMITFKDFPAEYRPKLEYFRTKGYARIPSFPCVKLSLAYASFDEYFQNTLSKATRKDLRRKFKKSEGERIEMEVLTDITPHLDEIYPLYKQVFDRTEFRFEELTKDYFRSLSEQMPDRTRYFVWRHEGRIVAFSLCMVHDGTIYDNYLGLDYGVALDLHLYFVTIRDIMRWAIDQKLEYYYSTPLNYDPKLRLRFALEPLDLYVAHTSRFLGPIFRRILPLMEPTRNDPTLKEFPNHHELWA